MRIEHYTIKNSFQRTIDISRTNNVSISSKNISYLFPEHVNIFAMFLLQVYDLKSGMNLIQYLAKREFRERLRNLTQGNAHNKWKE